MAYTITTTAGTVLATIADGTVNTSTTSLTLIGKNYAGYGVFLNSNYIKLLENFSDNTSPPSALEGQLWYDKGEKVLKVYSENIWKPISSSAASSTAPTSAVPGDLWWDTANAQLKVFPGSLPWVTIGPAYTATSGTSGAVVETILDTASGSHVVVKFYISNTTVAILSKDSTFTPQTSIAGFTTIKPGFNLISSSTITGSQFTGDASNALSLNGLTASSFLRNDQNTTTPYQVSMSSLVVGSSLTVATGTNVVNLIGGLENHSLDFYVNKGGVNTKAIGITGSTGAVSIPGALSVSGTGSVTGNLTVAGASIHQGITVVSNSVLPSANATINIGSTSSRFSTVYATSFNGTAVTAQYADLAERFEADVPMTPGTVVELGGAKEITAAVQELSEAVFGVISTLPGFLLNGAAGTDTSHPAVAVNGRVPVRVIGQVKKGDRLVSAGRGFARAARREELTAFNVLGRALANKTTDGEGLVEAIVKLNS